LVIIDEDKVVQKMVEMLKSIKGIKIEVKDCVTFVDAGNMFQWLEGQDINDLDTRKNPTYKKIVVRKASN
jgi:hypothetical protein